LFLTVSLTAKLHFPTILNHLSHRTTNIVTATPAAVFVDQILCVPNSGWIETTYLYSVVRDTL
jgi:hypothetical protein